MYHSRIISHFGFRSSSSTTDYHRTEALSVRAAIVLIGGLSIALWGIIAVVVDHL